MKARETEVVEESKMTQTHQVSELKKLRLCKLDRYPNIGKHCWSRGGQHFRIDKMHFAHWEKDMKMQKMVLLVTALRIHYSCSLFFKNR